MTAPGFSQNELSPDSDVSLLHFPVKLVHDLSNLFIEQNVIPFAVGSVATFADWEFVDPTNPLQPALKNLNIQPVWDVSNFYGEGWVEGFGAVGFWAGGALVNDLKLQEFGRDAAESLLLATVTVNGLKYTVGRERPDGTNDQSFPSGHTITAFSVAPVVSRYWGEEAGAAAYFLGTITALGRVEGSHHYLSDTIASATLGIIIGNAVVYHPKDVSLGVGLGQAELKLAFN